MKCLHLLSLAFSLGFFVSMSALAVDNKPELFLLKQYDNKQDVSGWLMSEKLDGVRAYWDGNQLLTRQGNPIHAPNWFIKDLPDFELDGELWIGRSKFAETLSIVGQHHPDKRWSSVGYYIFEVPNQPGGLLPRLQVLGNYLSSKSLSHLKIIPQVKIASDLMLQKELNRVVRLGGEGLVVRKENIEYQTGRLPSALKLKLKMDAECIVRGYSDGKGQFKGKVGALICELIPEQVKRLFPMLTNPKQVIKIGSGLTLQQRNNPPELGKMIQFQYMGTTKTGLPRFPVFLRERTIVNAFQ